MKSMPPVIGRFILLALLSFAIIGCEDNPASTDDDLTSIQVTAGSNTADFPNLFFTVDTSYFDWFLFWGTTSSDTLIGIYSPAAGIASGSSIALNNDSLLIFGFDGLILSGTIGDQYVINIGTQVSGTMDFTTANSTKAIGSFSTGASLTAFPIDDSDGTNVTFTKATIEGPFDMDWSNDLGTILAKQIDALKKSLR